MQKSCTKCGQSFEITQDDLAFYEKVSPVFNGKIELIPSPTLCLDCRQRRRMSWRNERSLYHRKCDLTGKSIISNFGAHTGMTVYDQHEWWTDKWDSLSYGRPFDFSRPFFDQFQELLLKVPQLSLSVWHSENADYCSYIGNVKNSYLIFGSVYSEDCYYGSPYYSKNCIDTLVVRECEYCYECVDCRKLYHCFYCQDCWHSDHLLFCYDLQGCSECIGCAGLRRKKYCIFNEQLSKEEYEKKKAELDLCLPAVREQLEQQLRELSLRIPHRYMQSNQTENVSGNYVYESRNVRDSFYADRCEDCRYCAQVVDLKDCYDNNYTEENELCYDYLGAYQVSRVSFSKFCNKISDSLYCDACHQGSHHLFGCIGLRGKSYCILNKQYTKEEYEKLVPKIIEHMRKDDGGAMNHASGATVVATASGGASSGSWGEFFPSSISPFGYNETVAQEYFPLSETDARKAGFGWHDEDGKRDKYLGPSAELPLDIESVGESICDKILTCEVTGQLYKIIPQELVFYKNLHLPLPRLCPNERHRLRLAMRNPRRLWKRACAKCTKAIATSYAPERPETVYCDECYLASVY